VKLPRKTALKTVLYVTAALFLAMPETVGAHHATATQFDVSRTVKLTGVISKLDWANPHVHLSLDVKSGDAVVEHWDVELASPGGVIVSGLSKDLLKPGTTVSVAGYPAKTNASGDASIQKAVCVKQLILADGTIATFVVGI
jgi:hypothetical protein